MCGVYRLMRSTSGVSGAQLGGTKPTSRPSQRRCTEIKSWSCFHHGTRRTSPSATASTSHTHPASSKVNTMSTGIVSTQVSFELEFFAARRYAATMRPVRSPGSFTFFVWTSSTHTTPCATPSFAFQVCIVYTRRNLDYKQSFRSGNCMNALGKRLVWGVLYLEPAVLLPIGPARLAQSALHVRRSPGVPLSTLHTLTAFASFVSPNASNQKWANISANITVATSVQYVR